MFYAIIKNEVKKMIDQEQAARTLINLIDVVHQENWVLLNKEDMASKTEEYYINFFKDSCSPLSRRYLGLRSL